MEANEFILTWTRMCKAHPGCDGCPVNGVVANCDLQCINTEYIKLVEKWGKDNTIKTNLQVANETWETLFGVKNAFSDSSCLSKNCNSCPARKGSICNVMDWWNEEYEGKGV